MGTDYESFMNMKREMTRKELFAISWLVSIPFVGFCAILLAQIAAWLPSRNKTFTNREWK